jgi:arylamine N-acetyltransferase
LLLNHERERAKWEQQLTDQIHQKEDFKSESERLKQKVDSYFKEIEKLKLDIKNARKTTFNATLQQQTAGGQY